MTINRFESYALIMNEEAIERLKTILKKSKGELNTDDIGFLQARRDYLSKADADEFSEFLTEAAIKENTAKIKKLQAVEQEVAPEPEAPVEEKVKEEKPKKNK